MPQGCVWRATIGLNLSLVIILCETTTREEPYGARGARSQYFGSDTAALNGAFN